MSKNGAERPTHRRSGNPPKGVSELRRDLVTGDWIVIAMGRSRRPHALVKRRDAVAEWQPKQQCPFENLQRSGNKPPILSLPKNVSLKKLSRGHFSSSSPWFVQVIPNKYPAFGSGTTHVRTRGPYEIMDGVGFHELVITRDHERGFAHFSLQEATATVAAYLVRYRKLREEPVVRYISIFHNSGREAGASVYHPHSQILAIPVVPPEVRRSLQGSLEYFRHHRRCVHCVMNAWEKKQKERVVFENRTFLALCPFVSRTAFEVRIFPKRHASSFDAMTEEEVSGFADALRRVLKMFVKTLGNPAYNFFIHTAHTGIGASQYYHWHLEIIPKVSIWAGFEIATGIEISTVEPAQAAAHLKRTRA